MLNLVDLKVAANKVGLELVAANIGFELWKGEAYKGGFTTLEAVAGELKTLAEVKEVKASAADSVKARLKEALAGATEAAVMINGKAVASVMAHGRAITLADGVTADGQPLNAREVTVSRSAKNLAAVAYSDQSCDAHLINNHVFYVITN